MREAVIVSAARTPIGKAYRGAFNNTAAPTLASYLMFLAPTALTFKVDAPVLSALTFRLNSIPVA